MKCLNLAACVLLIGCFWFSGCVMGPTTKEIRETMEPAGVRVEIQLNDGKVTDGELLTVSPDEIAVLTVHGVARLPVQLIDLLTTEQPPISTRPVAGQLSADDVDELRPVSRFPSGFPAGVLETLIELHGTHDVTQAGGDSS